MNYLQSRNSSIDFLRGIAILLVLFLHFQIFYRIDDSILNVIFSSSFIQAFTGNGNYGVTIFFVISGFLITSMAQSRYQQLNKIDILNFYSLRFSRIMPCLLLALFFITFFSLIHIHIFQNKINGPSFFITILSVLTFWHNVLMAKWQYFNYCLNIYWSLSVEEVFYLAFPIICILFRRISWLLLFWLSLIIIGPIYRYFHATDEITALYGYFSCFDAIAMGCCAAVLQKNPAFQWLSKSYLSFAAALMLVVVYFYKDIMANIVIGPSLIALSTALLLIQATVKSNTKFQIKNLFSKTIAWFGKNSYEIYLFHIIVLAFMTQIYGKHSLGVIGKIVWLGLFLLITVTICSFISIYYSQPVNDKLRQLFSKAFAKRKQSDVVTENNTLLAPE